MKGKKLAEVLEAISFNASLYSVDVYANGGGELTISMPQPEQHFDRWMKSKGFITNAEGEYIYRPRPTK